MLNSRTISDLNKAFEATPQGFVVVDQGAPRFVVIDYETYKNLKGQSVASKQFKRILVTGGAGYIGSVTVRMLQQKGYEVIVLDNLATGKKERLKDCQLIVADLADRAALNKIFFENRIDAVMHLAASIEAEESIIDPAKYFQNNVISGLSLLDAMVEHGVYKLVFSSSAAVYGEPAKIPIDENAVCKPTNPYGESKLMFEKILKWYNESYGLHSMSLRYFNASGAWLEEDLGYNHVGRESHIIPKILSVALGQASEIVVNGQDYETPDGTCIRDYIHVLDLAEAHVAVLKKLERSNGAYSYNVGNGIGYSVLEIVDAVVDVTGRMIPISFGPRRPGDPAKLVADVSGLKRKFGWLPKHDLKVILETSWQWQKKLKM